MIAIPNMELPKRCELCPCSYYSEGALSDICQVTDKPIDGKPTDCPLIEIVTCGECVHWYNDADCGMACEFTNMEQPSDGFCNWGERRTETLDERIKRGLKEWKEK